jgi:hypothetical protein
MKKILITILNLVLITSCDTKPSNSKSNYSESELNTLKEKLDEKDTEIFGLKNKIDFLERKVEKGKLIDKKDFKDTLDISDNFFVYEHTSEITQTSDPKIESVLRDFDQVKSEYGNGFFVGVMTFYNGHSLPLETENSKTDIHILIQSTELGDENKTFVISDFYNVDLKTLEKKNNSLILTFEHGKFPRKTEQIIIESESVKFAKK